MSCLEVTHLNIFGDKYLRKPYQTGASLSPKSGRNFLVLKTLAVDVQKNIFGVVLKISYLNSVKMDIKISKKSDKSTKNGFLVCNNP